MRGGNLAKKLLEQTRKEVARAELPGSLTAIRCSEKQQQKKALFWNYMYCTNKGHTVQLALGHVRLFESMSQLHLKHPKYLLI